ncbi:MAG: metalloregulator ArsR/SmtB family transcription factor [Firmicutes bacterium]|nr:metalloregulator ArsR/SmtB family transcription factor [Bacillota bacterium]
MEDCQPKCTCPVFHQEILDQVKLNLLSDHEYANLVELYKVLGDLTRIKILESIKEHELCVCDLGHLLGVSKSAISHQMRFLKKYNLVTNKRIGKMVYYHLANLNIQIMIDQGFKQLKGQLHD